MVDDIMMVRGTNNYHIRVEMMSLLRKASKWGAPSTGADGYPCESRYGNERLAFQREDVKPAGAVYKKVCLPKERWGGVHFTPGPTVK